MSAYSSKSVGTPISNARLLNESSEPCEINCTDILHIKTRTDTLTYFQTLSLVITRRSTVRPAWLLQRSQIPIYVLALWKRMQRKRGKVRIKIARYSVGQHVRISKEKTKFAKSAKQNFSTEVFRIIKVIHRTPRPV